jgi:hypothetical protein
MTRRKDKIRQKKKAIQKKRYLGKSRLFQQKEEKEKEIVVLKKVEQLPPELIRIIYNYMSGNGKLVCNYKLDYLERYNSLSANIEQLSKPDILNLIHKGILQKYPNIIENINDYFYNEEMQAYIISEGLALIDLWENNKLAYRDPLSNTNIDENILQVDQSIKFDIQCSIYKYVREFKQLYKKSSFPEHTLSLELDKICHLCKCLDYVLKRKRIYTAVYSIPEHSIPLIPKKLI